MGLISEFVDGRTPPDLYDAYLSTLFTPWAETLIETSPPAGRVLDIACGTGIVSRALAEQNDVSTVDAIDVADIMVEKAAALSTAFLNLKFQTASALDLPFDDNTFDAAYCQQGLQFFPDKARALMEARRIVKPGGAITFATWTFGADGNPVFGSFEQIIERRFGAGLTPFGPFSLGEKNDIEAIAKEAGAKIISLKRYDKVCRLPDIRTLVLFDSLFLGRPGDDGGLQPLFDPTTDDDDETIEAIIEELDDAVAAFRQSDGTLLAPSAAHILVVEA